MNMVIKMVGLDEVLNTLNQNGFIDKEVKSNIGELIIIFHKFFPKISLQNLNTRLRNLKIERTNKFVSKKIVNYYPVTNTLSFNVGEVKKDYDMRHVLMHGLLCIITAHDDTYGFDHNNKFIALNVGYTEILTNFLVGNSKELTLFDDEVIATNLIAELIGNDILFEAYFSNNPSLVADALVSEGEV